MSAPVIHPIPEETHINRRQRKVIGMNVVEKTIESMEDKSRRCAAWISARTCELAKSAKGQGTAEYAILVGVLVLVAILAIALLQPKLKELWEAIQAGVDNLPKN